MAKKKFELNLYIPIWFYSNGDVRDWQNWDIDFYIPIWFYSNKRFALPQGSHVMLYIPIWFYSNVPAKIVFGLLWSSIFVTLQPNFYYGVYTTP